MIYKTWFRISLNDIIVTCDFIRLCNLKIQFGHRNLLSMFPNRERFLNRRWVFGNSPFSNKHAHYVYVLCCSNYINIEAPIYEKACIQIYMYLLTGKCVALHQNANIMNNHHAASFTVFRCCYSIWNIWYAQLCQFLCYSSCSIVCILLASQSLKSSVK